MHGVGNGVRMQDLSDGVPGLSARLMIAGPLSPLCQIPVDPG